MSTMQIMHELTAFILTYGRPDNVKTYRTLREGGFTGRILLLVDDTDKTIGEYQANFGDQVVVFDKHAIAKTFDTADNFEDMRSPIYARNACFQIAREMGIRYFVQLDDDYRTFRYRFDSSYRYSTDKSEVRRLDEVFDILLAFLKATPTTTIALAQGGDFIGGEGGSFGRAVQIRRKAMNSFVCDAQQPFTFVGTLNDDVNTYTSQAPIGTLFFTANQIGLEQIRTQASVGGLTELYLASGTYVKSFYTILFQPSSVTIQSMGHVNPRLHHRITWKATTPMIIREDIRKERTHDHRPQDEANA